MKPLIGILANKTHVKDTSDIMFGSVINYVNQDYLTSVNEAGGIPLILPVSGDVEAQLENVSGIVLAGGDDIDPYLYHEEPHPKLGRVYKETDAYYLQVIEVALKKNLPILGICKGHQALNIYYGGTLYQDLRSQNEAYFKHVQLSFREESSHAIKIEKDSFLYEAYGEAVAVNSFHHQAIKDLGKDLKITATSSDGMIEAIEDQKKRVIGVQFHPEMLRDKGSRQLFKNFIKACL